MDSLPFRASVIVLVLLAVLLPTARMAQAEGPSLERLFAHDFGNYAVVTLQSFGQGTFEGDLVFGDGTRSRTAWGNAPAYVLFLGLSWHLVGESFPLAVALLRVLLIAAYCVGVWRLVRGLTRDPQVAVAIAALSLVPAGFAATGVTWGLLSDQLLPYHLLTTLSPWLLLWWRRLASTSPGGSAPRRDWLVYGLALGLATSLVHTVSGLAFTAWIGAISVLDGGPLRKTLERVVALGLGWAVGLLPYLARHDSLVASTTDPAASLTLALQDNTMVFPWRGNPFQRLLSPERNAWLAEMLGANWSSLATATLLVAHSVLSLGLLIRHRRGDERAFGLFLALQLAATTLLLNVGLLPIAIGLWYLVGRSPGRPTRRDLRLTIGLCVAISLGLTGQMLLLGMWPLLPSPGLATIVFEWARLAHFAYLAFYGLLAITLAEARTRGPGSITLGLFVVAIWLNLSHLFTRVLLAPAALALTMLAVAVPVIAGTDWRHGRRLAAALGAAGMAVGLSLMAAGALQPDASTASDTASTSCESTPLPDDLLAWVTSSTQPDSRFHLIPARTQFRPRARRPILMLPNEWTYGLHGPTGPQDLAQQIRLLYPPDDSTPRLEAAARQARLHGADFLALGDGLRLESHAARAVYRDRCYVVYSLDG